MSLATIQQLFIYPVKGLTPQEISDRVVLKAGFGIPGDRAFALMYQDADHQSESLDLTPWMSKNNFAVQNDWPGLAQLDCQYDVERKTLTIKKQGIELLVAPTNTINGRDWIGAFFTGYLASLTPTEGARHPHQAALHLVGTDTGETRYPDREPVHISLVSQATIDKISEVCSSVVDVRRFRPNIILTGISAWEEFNWIGQELMIGKVKIAIAAPIGRCLNIEVNPDTGDRDLPLFTLLKEKFGHQKTGILAKVITDGSVGIGDQLT